MAQVKDGTRPICQNRKAGFEYEVLEKLEAGLALTGSEVKSCRNGRANLVDAWVRFVDDEAWLMDAHISPYEPANRYNHEPRRPRKLLMKNEEIDKWSRRVAEKGLSVIAMRLYFKGSWVKAELGLGRGRKSHDKRAAIREREDRRDADRAQRGH
jgi:SsrA-binding protein